jgi:hypothetical protein
VKQTKVVHLARVRELKDLLAEWEKVRQEILLGQIDGFHTALRRGECETIYVGGRFKKDSEAAARAALKASLYRMLDEDPPLPAIRAVGT